MTDGGQIAGPLVMGFLADAMISPRRCLARTDAATQGDGMCSAIASGRPLLSAITTRARSHRVREEAHHKRAGDLATIRSSFESSRGHAVSGRGTERR